MFHSQKSTTSIFIAGLMALAAVAPANAADGRIAVPSPGGDYGGNVTGCWQAGGKLYGQYRLSFCLVGYQGGTYHVSGRNLHCSGTLTWKDGWWGGTDVRLSRSNCGGSGTDWTADKFTCQFKGGPFNKHSTQVYMPVPSRELDCTYVPAVWGYPWTTFRANRV